MLSKIAVDEFKNLYLQQYKQILTNELALKLGSKLVELVKAVYGNQLPDLKTIDSNMRKGQH